MKQFEGSHWFGDRHFEWLPFFEGHGSKDVDVDVFTDDDIQFEDFKDFREELEEELEGLKAELEDLKLKIEAQE